MDGASGYGGKNPGGFLIVDDISINIYVTQEMLLPYGVPIDSAESGPEAIEKIKQGNEYDIIFMDHMMPGMDGIETTDIIRRTGYTGCIVMLTANAPGENDNLYARSGFNKFICKPIDPNELDDIIYEYMDIDYVDIDDEDGSMQDVDMADMMDFFIADARHAVETLEKMCAEAHEFSKKEFETYETTVHGIKSALRNIDRPDIAEHARRLEEAARAGNTTVINMETMEFVENIKDLIEEMEEA